MSRLSESCGIQLCMMERRSLRRLSENSMDQILGELVHKIVEEHVLVVLISQIIILGMNTCDEDMQNDRSDASHHLCVKISYSGSKLGSP